MQDGRDYSRPSLLIKMLFMQINKLELILKKLINIDLKCFFKLLTIKGKKYIICIYKKRILREWKPIPLFNFEGVYIWLILKKKSKH